MANLSNVIEIASAEQADALEYSANGTLTAGFKIWVGTEAEYTAIGAGNYDSKTLYIQT